MNTNDRTLDLTLAQLDRLASFYPRVDGKAAFLLALNISLASIMVLNVDFSRQFSISPHGLATITSLFLALSCAELSVTFFPHLQGGLQSSHLYFGDIAKLPCEKFFDDWKALTTEQRVRDATIQVWRNSEILDVKFRSSERAFKLTMLSIVPWAAVMASVVMNGHALKLS